MRYAKLHENHLTQHFSRIFGQGEIKHASYDTYITSLAFMNDLRRLHLDEQYLNEAEEMIDSLQTTTSIATIITNSREVVSTILKYADAHPLWVVKDYVLSESSGVAFVSFSTCCMVVSFVM